MVLFWSRSLARSLPGQLRRPRCIIMCTAERVDKFTTDMRDKYEVEFVKTIEKVRGKQVDA